MRLRRLVTRGYRNLVDLDRLLPESGVALLGRNGQGKTNLLEAMYYPVLFRSFRGSADPDVFRFGGIGFHVEIELVDGDGDHTVAATYTAGQRRKRIVVDGEEAGRLTDAVGRWLGVAFLPSDVGLASGPATERRHYLDRMLSLGDRGYLTALSRYRAALAQRNSALRQGRSDVAQAFDAPLAAAGALLVRARLAWADAAAPQFAEEFALLGEPAPAELRYCGRPELAEPETWPAALDEVRARDRARGISTIGPHRDDVALLVGGRPLRSFGSTGQQRSAAVALKLIEIATLRAARQAEPGLLLDDVFAELDRERQTRLAARLLGTGAGDGTRQVFVSAPRRDELPEALELPVWSVEGGIVNEVAA